eukprot:Opistho-2@62590
MHTRLSVLGLLRLNRVLRVYKAQQFFAYLESKISAKTEELRTFRFIVFITLFVHWLTCIVFLTACYDDTCDIGSWAGGLNDSSFGHRYIICMYWVVTMICNVGYGDITASTDGERILATFIMVAGIIFFGFITASIAAALANADAQRSLYQEKLNAIMDFMREAQLEDSLQLRVKKYYEYLWRRNRGVNARSLFQDLPLTFQGDVCLSIYQSIIEKVPLFQNTEIGFMRMLSLVIKPILFLRREYIVNKGDVGNEMFFIHRGTVEVVSPDGKMVFAKMEAGAFFGEISLIFSCPRTASIRAATNCDLFVLTKRDLDEVLEYYPQITEQINLIASNRYNVAKKREESKDNQLKVVDADEVGGLRSNSVAVRKASSNDPPPMGLAVRERKVSHMTPVAADGERKSSHEKQLDAIPGSSADLAAGAKTGSVNALTNEPVAEEGEGRGDEGQVTVTVEEGRDKKSASIVRFNTGSPQGARSDSVASSHPERPPSQNSSLRAPASIPSISVTETPSSPVAPTSRLPPIEGGSSPRLPPLRGSEGAGVAGSAGAGVGGSSEQVSEKDGANEGDGEAVEIELQEVARAEDGEGDESDDETIEQAKEREEKEKKEKEEKEKK